MESGSQSQLLEKSKLLQEMLRQTQAFIKFLEPIPDLTDELLTKLVEFLEARDNLMGQIDKLDQELVAQGVQIQLSQEDSDIVNKLQDYQLQIVKFLNQSKSKLGQELSKLQTSKEGLKGYYNQHVASNPSFIDNKR